MEKNTTAAAPQFSNMSGVYDRWLDTHTGTEKDFLEFVGTPSPERTSFLVSLQATHEITEGTLTTTYRP